MKRFLFAILRTALVAISGRGYDRSQAINNLHHRLSYRLHKMLPRFGIAGEQVVPVPLAPGLAMVVRAEDGGVGHQLLMYHAYEPFESSCVLNQVRPDDVVFVVGANIGYYPLLLASHARQVVAIEPAPSNLVSLRKSIGLNAIENITLIPCAVGPRDSEASLSLSQTNSGDHQLRDVAGRAQVVVPVRSLDSLILVGTPPPNILLMDIQGSEFEALNGARMLLSSAQLRCIFMELWPGGLEAAQAGATLELLRLLKDHKFELHQIDERHCTVRLLDESIINSMSSTEEMNLLCVRS